MAMTQMFALSALPKESQQFMSVANKIFEVSQNFLRLNELFHVIRSLGSLTGTGIRVLACLRCVLVARQ